VRCERGLSAARSEPSRLVQVEYLAGGLATAVELGPDADKRWRLKPERSGPSLVLGDIGTHAHHLVSFVTGQPFEAVSADVGTLLPDRKVHDVALVRFRLGSGVRRQLELNLPMAKARGF
jgi:predicted dehydrogenase